MRSPPKASRSHSRSGRVDRRSARGARSLCSPYTYCVVLALVALPSLAWIGWAVQSSRAIRWRREALCGSVGSPPFLPNFSLPPFTPLPTCRNVFVFSTAGAAGLGHRVTALAIALALAKESSTAVVIESPPMLEGDRWDDAQKRFTGSFPFIADMFALKVSWTRGCVGLENS